MAFARGEMRCEQMQGFAVCTSARSLALSRQSHLELSPHTAALPVLLGYAGPRVRFSSL